MVKQYKKLLYVIILMLFSGIIQPFNTYIYAQSKEKPKGKLIHSKISEMEELPKNKKGEVLIKKIKLNVPQKTKENGFYRCNIKNKFFAGKNFLGIKKHNTSTDETVLEVFDDKNEKTSSVKLDHRFWSASFSDYGNFVTTISRTKDLALQGFKVYNINGNIIKEVNDFNGYNAIISPSGGFITAENPLKGVKDKSIVVYNANSEQRIELTNYKNINSYKCSFISDDVLFIYGKTYVNKPFDVLALFYSISENKIIKEIVLKNNVEKWQEVLSAHDSKLSVSPSKNNIALLGISENGSQHNNVLTIIDKNYNVSKFVSPKCVNDAKWIDDSYLCRVRPQI